MNQIVIGDCIIDELQGALIGPDNSVEKLSGPEQRVLIAMAECVGQSKSKIELERVGWGGGGVSDSSLTVAITKIRKKIKISSALSIITVPREGYKLSVNLNALEKKEAGEVQPTGAKPKKIKIIRNVSVLVVLVVLVMNWYLYQFLDIACEGKQKIECFTEGEASLFLNMNENINIISKKTLL